MNSRQSSSHVLKMQSSLCTGLEIKPARRTAQVGIRDLTYLESPEGRGEAKAFGDGTFAGIPGLRALPEGCLRSERRGRGTVAATATSSPRWRGDRHLVSMANVNQAGAPGRGTDLGRAARSACPAPRPAVTSGPQPDQARPRWGEACSIVPALGQRSPDPGLWDLRGLGPRLGPRSGRWGIVTLALWELSPGPRFHARASLPW